MSSLWTFALVATLLTLLASGVLAHALLARGGPPPARRGAAVLALAVPLAAAGLYAALGRPDAMSAAAARPADPVQAMVSRLAQRLALFPDDAEGWALLVRSYETLGRLREALPAYEQLERLRPDDPQVLTQHAVTLALVRGEGLAGEPEALLQRALALDARQVPTLGLLAAAAEERGDEAAAGLFRRRALQASPLEKNRAGEQAPRSGGQ